MLPFSKEVASGPSSIDAVSARDLHAYLEVSKDFTSWVKTQVNRAGLIAHKDFEVFTLKGAKPQGGRPGKDYMLTRDAAKKVAMMCRTARGTKVRNYFIECERQVLNPVAFNLGASQVPQTLAEALRMAADQARENERQPESVIMLE